MNYLPLFEEEENNNSSKTKQKLETRRPFVCRSKRLQDIKKVAQANQTIHSDFDSELNYLRQAFEAEVFEGLTANDFLPAPNHWRDILKMPEKQKRFWLKALYSEAKLLIVTMKCFSKEQPNDDDPIILVTAKFRTKINSDGTIDKLKARICIRGDMQAQYTEFDTWCPIGNFRDLKIFLAFAAHYKCRVHQLDFIGAFLQAIAKNRTFTTLPTEWKELFPDLADWFGTPLKLLKSIYGSTDSTCKWDDTLSDFLVKDFGSTKCPSSGSINIFKKGELFMFLLNVVDDQLYFTNDDNLRKDFEKRTTYRFDAELMGQAHWYLQARLNQRHDYSIVLDQSRYMALIVAKILPQHKDNKPTENEITKFAAPLPSEFIPTIKDKSKNLLAYQDLQQEYGFAYPTAIGMLIFLLNTAIILHFSIRKLAKFNNLPGKTHYKALIHLIQHIRMNKNNYGLQFYSPEVVPPIHQRILEHYPDFDFKMHPIIVFTDSSWHDCPDTSRSTGCYYTYVFGSLVDSASFVPSPIALSSAEAEYNACAFAITAALHTKQLFNSFSHRHPDSPVTIALFVDSKSAICMMNNDKDTKRTRHIERRINFVRQARATGVFIPYKIPGEENVADVGTKNLPAATLKHHQPCVHISVDP